MANEPQIGDTVRIALGRETWKLVKIVELHSGLQGMLEKPDGKGTITTFHRMSGLVKVEEKS